MRAKFLTVLGVVCLVFTMAAQGFDPPKNAVVNYKDGSVFKGTLIYSKDGSFRMVVATGDTIKLNITMIKKILDRDDYIVTKKDKFHKRKGFFNYTSLTFGSHNFDYSAQLQTVLGYRYTDRLSLGVGVALEGHDISVADNFFYHRYLSTFGYGRYYLNNKNWRLYTDAKMGYAFNMEPDIFFNNATSEDGFLFQPGLGIHIASRNNFKMHFGMSYVFIRTSGSGADWSGDIQYDYDVWINRLVFNLGFELW